MDVYVARYGGGRYFLSDREAPPTPCHSTFSPRSGFNFNICDNIRSHATGDNRADGESHNIPYQVSGRTGCSRGETRASETGFGRAGESQETAINILRGSRCEQPLTHRVLLDL